MKYISLLVKGHVQPDKFYLTSDGVKSHLLLSSASNSKVKLCVDVCKRVQVSVRVCMGVQVCVDVSSGVCAHACVCERECVHTCTQVGIRLQVLGYIEIQLLVGETQEVFYKETSFAKKWMIVTFIPVPLKDILTRNYPR